VRIVIIGGGAAGMSAASRARKLSKDAQITVIEESPIISHAPCGIPYYIEGLFSDESLFSAYTPSQFAIDRDVKVLIKSRAIEVRDGEILIESNNEKRLLEFDKLIIATGARPRLPDVPISGNILTIHHPTNANQAKYRLWSANDVVIVGSGLISIEVAEALVNLGKRVTIVTRSSHVLSKMLDPEMANIVEERLARDVKIIKNADLHEISGESGKTIVRTSEGSFEGDIVVIATGINPNSELARDAGLSIGENGGILVDDHMRTSKSNIFAAGDVVETTNLVTGKRVIAPFGPVANKMGYVAGVNASGGDIIFPGVVLTSLTRYRDLEIGATGIKESEANNAGLKPRSAIIKARTRSRYYPGGGWIWIKLISDVDNKIIGAQVIGNEGVLARIDVLAVLIQHGLSINDLFFAELGYLPPLSTVWDPLIIAARQLMPEG